MKLKWQQAKPANPHPDVIRHLVPKMLDGTASFRSAHGAGAWIISYSKRSGDYALGYKTLAQIDIECKDATVGLMPALAQDLANYLRGPGAGDDVIPVVVYDDVNEPDRRATVRTLELSSGKILP